MCRKRATALTAAEFMIREPDLQTRFAENSVSYDGKSKVRSKSQGVEKSADLQSGNPVLTLSMEKPRSGQED
jgi:hypothetical protein